MTEAARNISYPARHFMASARAAFADGADVCIRISPGWRMRLLTKTLDFWPKIIDDNERLKAAPGAYFGMTSVLLFSLFHTHTYALASGYTMSHSIGGMGVAMNYSRKCKRDLVANLRQNP